MSIDKYYFRHSDYRKSTERYSYGISKFSESIAGQPYIPYIPSKLKRLKLKFKKYIKMLFLGVFTFGIFYSVVFTLNHYTDLDKKVIIIMKKLAELKSGNNLRIHRTRRFIPFFPGNGTMIPIFY